MRYITSFLMAISVLCSMHANANSITLRDKIGQMLLIGFYEKNIHKTTQVVKYIEKNNIGGVILFDYNYRTKSYDRNIESPAQLRKLNRDLQKFSKQANTKYHRPQLPLLISLDYEGGEFGTRLNPQHGFPATIPADAVSQKSLIEADVIAASMANTLKAEHFNLNFAPVLDVNVNPENPVIAKKHRSFSSDPSAVANYAQIFTKNLLKHNIQCAYKHFPGHGSSTADSHLGFVDVSDTWQSYELEPYYKLLNQDFACGMVMTAHIVNRNLDESGLPATLSHKILTGLLREQLHFNGVIITDDMQMQAISAHYGLENAVELAINAGADMLLFGNNLGEKAQDPAELIDLIESKVKSGAISPARIDEAYERIVALKRNL